MSQDNDFYAINFTNLFSGCNGWSMRLVDCNTHSLLAHQNCLPSELSKLLIWSGEHMIERIQHQNRLYDLQELQVQPASRQINLLVQPSVPGTNTHLVFTPAQKILDDQLIKQLQSPAAQLLAFIKLNDHLFTSDPANLIVLIGESQYDEYDYLAAAILMNLQQDIHPEYVFRTLFDKMGLGGRYGDETLNKSINTLEQILRQVHEPSPLTDTVLSRQPAIFTCSALLYPVMQQLAPSTEEGSSDIWSYTLEMSNRLLAGDNVVSALRAGFQDPDYALSDFDSDELAYLMESIRQTAAKASILSKTRTYQALLNPSPGAVSRFDTGLTDLQLFIH